MTRFAPAALLRRSLALSSALGMSLGVVAAPAEAQAIIDITAPPQGATVNTVSTGLPGSNTRVTVNDQRAVVNWATFNVAQNTQANFVNSSSAQTAVVLNRVTTLLPTNTTTLAGQINAVNNLIGGAPNNGRGVEVWISNPNGILMGATGNFNTQGLVLTTRSFDATDVANFRSGAGALTLTAPVLTPNAGITGTAGQIVTNGRVLAFIAPVIQLSGGTFNAGAGDAGFVVASDVTISNPGSPLGLTINAGTALSGASGDALRLAGTVTAGNAYMVVSAQAAVDALLDVSANVTTASASNGIVVLGGDNAGLAVGPITVGAVAGNSGTVALTTSGTLTANGGGDVRVLSNGAITIQGNITAGDDLFIRGGEVTLGLTDLLRVLRAPGDVSVTAQAGALTGLGNMVLAADTDGSGDAMALSAATGFALSTATLVSGIPDGTASANIDFATSTSAEPFVLGAVRAGTLSQGGVAGLNRTGDITTGALTLAGANTIGTTGALTTGAVATAGALTLRGDAGVTTGALSGAGAKTLTSAASITASSVRGAGAVTLTGGTAAGQTIAVAGGIGASGASAASLSVNGGAATVGNLFVTGATQMGQGAGLTSITAGNVDTGSLVADASGATAFGAVRARTGGIDVASSGGSVQFSGAVDAPGVLTVQAAPAGSVTFAGAVGQVVAPSSFASVGAGQLILNGGALTTVGAQSFGGQVVLGANTVLTGAGASFAGGVDGAGSGVDRDLALNFSGAATLAGGGFAGINNLATDTVGAPSGGTALSGTFVTSGSQTFNDAVTLTGATTLTSTGTVGDGNDHRITFAGTLDGPAALIVATPGTLRFGGTVGAGAALASLTAASVGAVAIQGAGVTTTGAQAYGVTTLDGGLAGGVTINAGVGDVSFAALNGPRGLTVNSGGATTLAGGGGAALAFVTTDAGGTTTVSGPLQTTGTLTFNDPLSLGGDTVLTGTLASFNAGLTGNGNDLTINTSGAQLLGPGVSGVRNLATDAAGMLTLAGDIATTGAQSYGEATTLGTTLTLTAGSAITFGGALDSATGAEALTTNALQTTFNGDVGVASALAALSVGGAASTGGGVARLVRTTGLQSYGGILTLGANTTLVGSGASFGGGVDGGNFRDLTLTFAADSTLGASPFVNLGSLTVNGAGVTTLGSDITTRDGQLYVSALVLGGPVTLTSTGGGGIELNAVTGAQALTANTGGVTTFNNALTGLASLATDAGGSTVLRGGVSTSGAQSYGDDVVLDGDLAVASTGGGAIGFGGTVTGARALTVDTAGVTTFGGAVGQVGSATSPTALTVTGGGAVRVDGGAITTAGAQSYAGQLQLGTDTVLTGAAGSLGGGVLGGGFDLTLNFSGQTAISGGSFSGVDDLATGGGGTTALAGTIVTAGGQTYGDDVLLVGATVLRSDAGAIAFGGTLDGARALTVRTGGTTSFGGAVGGGTALASLTVDGSGEVAVNGGAVTTTGAQIYAGAATLAQDTVLTTDGAAVGFGSTVDGAVQLSVRAEGGAASFGGAIGGATALTGLAIRANSATLATGNRVGTLAAAVGTGGLSFADAGALTVGTVDGLTGVATGAGAATLSAGGLLTLNADIVANGASLTGAGITQAAGTTVNAGAGEITLDGNDGAISLGGALATSNAGAGAVRLLDAGATQLGAIATGPGGTLTLGGGGADGLSGDVTQAAGTTLSAGTLTGNVGGAATLGGANPIGTLAGFVANGFALRTTGGLAVTGRVDAGAGALSLQGGAGALSLGGDLVAGGVVTLAFGGGIQQNAGNLIAASTLTGSAGGPVSLTGANRIGTLAGFSVANGGFSLVNAQALAITADLAAAGALLVRANGIDFSGRSLSATGAATLDGLGGAVRGGTLTAGGGGDLIVTGGTIALTGAAAGGAATLTASSGDLTVGTGTASGAMTLKATGAIGATSLTTGGDVLIDAGGLASLGQVAAGAAGAISIAATDAAITGAQRAARVTFTNRTPGAVTVKLGDGVSAGGFQLEATEVNLVEAGQLTFDGGAGNVEIGALAFDADAGRQRVDVLTTGRIDVSGAVSGAGASRAFRFGGTAATLGDKASVIRVVATPTAGGRLLFEGADLDLRGVRIGVGQASGFLDPIGFGNATGLSAAAVGAAFVANPNSSLYNAQLGGLPYAAGTSLVTARTLTVRFGSYALFQNTGVPGQNLGVTIGGTTAAQNGALVVQGPGGSNAFALFGTIGGIADASTAVLGPSVIGITGADVANFRINGCLAGLGTGCLTAVVTQPLLAVFDVSQVVVLRSGDALAVPFDPVIGTNNEALFSGLGLIDGDVTPTECAPGSTNPACGQNEELPQ